MQQRLETLQKVRSIAQCAALYSARAEKKAEAKAAPHHVQREATAAESDEETRVKRAETKRMREAARIEAADARSSA